MIVGQCVGQCRLHGEKPSEFWNRLGEKASPCSAFFAPELARGGFREITIIPPSSLTHVLRKVPARVPTAMALDTTNPLRVVTRILLHVPVRAEVNGGAHDDAHAVPASRSSLPAPQATARLNERLGRARGALQPLEGSLGRGQPRLRILHLSTRRHHRLLSLFVGHLRTRHRQRGPKCGETP